MNIVLSLHRILREVRCFYRDVTGMCAMVAKWSRRRKRQSMIKLLRNKCNGCAPSSSHRLKSAGVLIRKELPLPPLFPKIKNYLGALLKNVKPLNVKSYDSRIDNTD